METINHEYYVSLGVAKLLKQAGFRWCVGTAYRDGVIVRQENSLCDNFNGKHYENGTRHEFFSAPTLDVAQRWLREVKKLYIEIRRMPKCDLFDRYFTSLRRNFKTGLGIIQF